MNAVAHDSALTSVDNVWPEDPGEDGVEMGLQQRAAVYAATGVALVGHFTAIVLQTAYHAVNMLRISLGLRLLLVAKAIAHIGAASADRLRASLNANPQNGELEVRLSLAELALIYKSLEAAKTLRALPRQNELLDDTIHVVDQSLKGFVR
jgi:hypothetical protein